MAEKAFSKEIHTGSHGFALSSEFWSHFVKHYWGEKPLLIKNPFTPAMTTTEELFATLRKASAEFELKGGEVQYRFYKSEEGFLLEGSKLGRYIPNERDLSVTDYVERINTKLNGERFGLVLNELQQYDAQFYLRIREFLKGLAVRLSVRCSASTGVFLGNYEKTPFGIHKDKASVFHFIVHGGKRIYLWPEKCFRDAFDKLRDSDFEMLRNDATILEGEAGDVLYWPSSYWHVGESVGDLSIGVSLVLTPVDLSKDIFKDITNRIEEIIEPSLDGDVGFPHTLKEVEDGAEKISETVRLVTNLLRQTSRDSDFLQSLQASWLNRMSSSGSDPVPSPLPIETLNDERLVHCLPEFPILWIAASNNQILCSANGHSFTLPAAPNIIKLLKRLNSGATLRVAEFIKAYTGESRSGNMQFNVTDEGIRLLLSKLYSLRAISGEPT